jgi:hypothetical protein
MSGHQPILESYSAGVYVNHLDADDSAARVHAAYGANLERRQRWGF